MFLNFLCFDIMDYFISYIIKKLLMYLFDENVIMVV